MSKFAIVIKGKNEFKRALYDDMTKTDIAARNIVTEGAKIIAVTAKEEFRSRPAGSQRTSKRTGRVYYAGAPNYPASPPNPTTRSGNLRSSIRRLNVTTDGRGRWMSNTGSNVNYAGFVEYGTSRSREFPFMKIALIDARDKIEELARREWALALD